ncbi:hypothetical protein JCM31598_30310 [Desulfonatronum parangueonense]
MPEAGFELLNLDASAMTSFQVRFISTILLAVFPLTFVWLFKKKDSLGHGPLNLLAPLAALPIVGIVSIHYELLTISFATNFRFFFPLALLAIVIGRFWKGDLPSTHPARYWLAIFLLPVWVFSAWLCFYTDRQVGTSSGDEVVYIIKTDSLFTDRTLDMKQSWARLLHGGDVEQLVPREHMHLDPTARDGHWYSWHPVGLPLLLAPFWLIAEDQANLLGRSIGMGLLATLGVLGLWLLCKRAGASDKATLLTLTIVCGSVYWLSFSSRVLTEIPGAALLIWLFWAISATKDRPWSALVVAILTTAYCPFMHLRLLPLGMTGGFFYLLAVFKGPGERNDKLLRTGLYVGAVAVAYAGWVYLQWRLFETPSRPVSENLFYYLPGVWQIFLDRYAAGAGFLALYALLAAQVVWLLRENTQRLVQYGIMAVFVVCVILNCTNIYMFVSWWDSTPGRYLFFVVPLLAPGLAVTLTTASRPARTFFLFLGLVSLATTFVYFSNLSEAPKRTLAHHLLFLAQQPEMLGFFMPFATYYEHSPLVARIATAVFAVTFFFCSYVLLRLKTDYWGAKGLTCVALLVLTGVIAHAAQPVNPNLRVLEPTRLYIEILAVNTHQLTGKNAPNPDRDEHMVRIGLTDEHLPDYLAFGRHTALPEGQYLVEFDFKLEPESVNEPIITLEVATDEGKRILLKEYVSGQSGWTTKRLNLNIDEPTIVEPRVFYHGTGDAMLAEIRIRQKD